MIDIYGTTITRQEAVEQRKEVVAKLKHFEAQPGFGTRADDAATVELYDDQIAHLDAQLGIEPVLREQWNVEFNFEVALKIQQHLIDGTLWNELPAELAYQRIKLVDDQGIDGRLVAKEGWVEDEISVSFPVYDIAGANGQRVPRKDGKPGYEVTMVMVPHPDVVIEGLDDEGSLPEMLAREGRADAHAAVDPQAE